MCWASALLVEIGLTDLALLVEIGLTDLPTSEGAMVPWAPPLTAGLSQMDESMNELAMYPFMNAITTTNKQNPGSHSYKVGPHLLKYFEWISYDHSLIYHSEIRYHAEKFK